MSDPRRITHRTAVSYIDRSREHYAAQGYPRPYAWPRHHDAPFTPLGAPLAGATVAVVTTSRPPGHALDEPYAAPSDPPPDRMDTSGLAWDRDATHTDDTETFLPLRALGRLRDAGRIAAVGPRFYGVPTLYSQRLTRERDARRVEAWCREDGVDAVVLVPL